MSERDLYDCDNCGYSWRARNATPRRCPDCGSRAVHLNEGALGRANRSCASCAGTIFGLILLAWLAVLMIRNMLPPTVGEKPPSSPPEKATPKDR